MAAGLARGGTSIVVLAALAAGFVPRGSRDGVCRRWSNPDFFEEALGDASSAFADRRPLLSPLGGVSVSPRGFVAILASEKAEGAAQRALPVLLHRADVERVTSPTALTILQLLQGIDVATASQLPTDALDVAFGGEPESLAKVRCVLATVAPEAAPAPRSADFEAGLGAKAEKLAGALASKLGVAVSEEDGARLLRKFAADDGSLDRDAFSEVVAAARALAAPVDRDESCAFELVAASGNTAIASPFLAIALALRHNAPLVLGDALFDAPLARDADDLLRDLPVKRSEELVSDGARLSAHFATMFDTATKGAAAKAIFDPPREDE